MPKNGMDHGATRTALLDRRGFLTRLGCVAGALAAGRGLRCAAAPAKRPNVLFLAIDDLRPELGCYGHPLIRSPNIDGLASQGLRFTRAYCQQAVCGPTRMSLLSGLRPDSTRVTNNTAAVLSKALPDTMTLPQCFRSNGYETVSLGKIYHSSRDDNEKGWSSPAWYPREGDWKGRGYLTAESQGKILPGKGGRGRGPAFEAAVVADDAYPDGKTAAKAVAELKRLRASDKPFFLAVGIVKPHLPFNAPQRYWDLYDRESIRLSAHSNWPGGMPSFAGTSWGELRNYPGIPKKGRLDDELSRTLIHGYYACVSYMDALVGQVMGALDELGLRDDTIVILWGDHGWKLSDYGAWCKHTNLEIDTHVPMLLSVPGQRSAGKACNAFVEFVDIYPTLAELCGLQVPAHCEGTSMAPLLTNPDHGWKQAAFSQYPRSGVMGYSMRTERWRYTEWISRKGGEATVTARELYDHAAGALADKNLADAPEHAETVRRLSALLAKGKGWKAMQKQL